jgi:hypothetical protein
MEKNKILCPRCMGGVPVLLTPLFTVDFIINVKADGGEMS